MERPAGGSLTGAPMREFNTAGPIIPEDPYHIAPLARLDREDLLRLIERKKYFVLHAPRQTGKTTILRALRCKLVRGASRRPWARAWSRPAPTWTAAPPTQDTWCCSTAAASRGDEKVFRREDAVGGARVTVWGARDAHAVARAPHRHRM